MIRTKKIYLVSEVRAAWAAICFGSSGLYILFDPVVKGGSVEILCPGMRSVWNAEWLERGNDLDAGIGVACPII